MKKIFMLTDYKNHFGSKYTAKPYRSGMDKNLLVRKSIENGYELVFEKFSDVSFEIEKYRNNFVVYTSQEDVGGEYKEYIEDIVLGLENIGAITIPSFKYLRAHNNKSFMEIIAKELIDNSILLKSFSFGTLEELKAKIDEIKYPVVIKSSSGALSSGVKLAKDKNRLLKEIRKISRSKSLFKELWDFVRSLKYKGYIRESKYRKKFILQSFVPNLENDWKVLIYGNKYYCLKRFVRNNDFRASGSGIHEFSKELPAGLLEFSRKIKSFLNLPNISIDVCFNGNDFFLVEFQALYFGTKTIEFSEFYYENDGNNFQIIEEKSILENIYMDSVIKYIQRNYQ